MPVFRYQAIDQQGRDVSGILPAVDEPNLEDKLKNSGMWLIEAKSELPVVSARRADSSGSAAAWGKVRRRDLIEFCTVMGFQARAGIPLVQALEMAGADCPQPRFRNVVTGVRQHVESGLLFHEALEKFPRAFSPHFISVIRAGELSSKLPEAFDDLKAYLEWMEKVMADVRQASLYPAITLVVVLSFGLFLFTFIIPKFIALLNSVKVPIPLITRVIFGISDFARASWWVWVLLLLFIAVGIPVGRRCSSRFAYAVDFVKIRLPLFGELNLMVAISRFAHNLSILYSSGIPIIASLNLCQGLIACRVVEDAVAEVESDVKTGHTIGEAMRKHAVFPPMLLRMVAMGERTGTLDQALRNVADFYNEIVPRRIKKLFTFLEPALTLSLILMVGVIALAIYLPLLSLMGSIGH